MFFFNKELKLKVYCIFFSHLKISEDIRGARAAIRDTIPFPT